MTGVSSKRMGEGSAPHPYAAPRPTTSMPVPAIGRPLKLPDSFGQRFMIFADAEEEFDWSGPFSRENIATTAIQGLVGATDWFNKAGAYPTYLVDYPVVNNPESAAVMRALVSAHSCEIGTQLHPWVTPPFDEMVSAHNSFTGNLPLTLQRAKLETLTDKITQATGVRPISYRAGRYGLGSETMNMLTETGYVLDVSVRARFDYAPVGGVNYEDHPVWPWRVNDQLIELPLSTAFTGVLRKSPSLFKARWFHGTLARTGLISRVPLTPEGVPLSDAISAIKALDDEGLRVFSLSFHTPSVIPGHTPYVRTEKDLAIFWRWWDGVFNQFAKMAITPARESEFIAAAKASAP